jgi:hypothetical protein
MLKNVTENICLRVTGHPSLHRSWHHEPCAASIRERRHYSIFTRCNPQVPAGALSLARRREFEGAPVLAPALLMEPLKVVANDLRFVIRQCIGRTKAQ